jgi:hypothetical protein
MSANTLNKTFVANMRQNQRRPLNSIIPSAPVNFGDTNRNDSASYGYPDALDFNHLYNAYRRGGFFNAIVDIIPERCFSDDPFIVDGDEDTPQDTQFEKAVKKLVTDFDLWRVFETAFKMADVGQYSTIVPVISEPTENKLENPITQGRRIIAINPWYELECEANQEYDADYSSPNYNKPLSYKLQPSQLSGRQTTNAEQHTLHYSRVKVITNAVGATIYGESVLEPAFNALFDANKVRGASSEGYRKNAMQKYILSANNAEAAKAFNAKKEVIDEALDDFNDNFNSALRMAGVNVTSLQTQLQDPKSAWEICVVEACASRGVSFTELVGFMTGERASTQNSSAFTKRLKKWQKKYSNDIHKFLSWLVGLGLLPKPSSGEFKVCWPDIGEPSTTEKLDNAGKMTSQNEQAFRAGQEAPWTMEEIRQIGGSEPDKPDTDYDPKEDLNLDDDSDEKNTPD